MRRTSRRISLLLSFAVLGFAPSASALPVGTLLVADSGGRLVAVDPGTGDQTLISADGLFFDPFAVEVESNGQLVVVDEMGLGGTGRVVRVDPATGEQTLVSSGGVLVAPLDIVVAPDGSLYVIDIAETFEADSFIARIDPVTGDQTVVFSDPAFIGTASRIGIDREGRLLISGGREMAGIIRLDLATGLPELIVPRPAGVIPPYFLDTAVDSDGVLFISGGGNADLFRIDLDEGILETIFDGAPSVLDTRGLVVEADGNVLFSSTRQRGIFRLDPTTGIATELTSGGNLSVPLGLALVPAPAPFILFVTLVVFAAVVRRRAEPAIAGPGD